MITVYTTPNCPKCNATKWVLAKVGHKFEEVIVTEAIADELSAVGFVGAPVVVTDYDSWEGYRPDLIKGLNARSSQRI